MGSAPLQEGGEQNATEGEAIEDGDAEPIEDQDEAVEGQMDDVEIVNR